MLYFAPRNKASTTFYAWMVELVDTTDLKSVDPKGRAGSSPAPGTKREIAAMRSPVFGVDPEINCRTDDAGFLKLTAAIQAESISGSLSR